MTMRSSRDCHPIPLSALRAAGGASNLAELFSLPKVAIGGARHSTYYGQETAARLAHDLAQAGVAIVAGLTEGIEAQAHHAVLQTGRPTIAVVPGSPDIPYPPSQKHLHAKVKRQGYVVGPAEDQRPAHEHPWTQHPGHDEQNGRASPNKRDPLLERNQLIAELADVVILIEATKGAAAMQTAERALELGKAVGAVPGRITDESAEGPNRLIKDGAHPILEAKDVLDLLGRTQIQMSSLNPTGCSPPGTRSPQA